MRYAAVDEQGRGYATGKVAGAAHTRKPRDRTVADTADSLWKSFAISAGEGYVQSCKARTPSAHATDT